ncbi:alpha/beta fold hydrolase [Tardiphaga alba]|uniref:Alpha/beta fold hydrolase n=1 Tax=Tardiphaga alba TaxID=340268 RepID=A0ABX8ACW4_9BRAD|nr:alpha/beta fold hydrolase [Tardiphaga alba]QUS41611.1 alpha/beta fold hydrolase [Tardiphaga alba]
MQDFLDAIRQWQDETILDQATQSVSEAVTFPCGDGYHLHGHFWRPRISSELCSVIINPATGVLARYYHPYARYLAENGFSVLTYDYRGIGLSRPTNLRSARFRWRDWGELDFAAAIDCMRSCRPSGLLAVVGHSIGGFLPGFAPNAGEVDRLLAIAGQFAYWRDYGASHRARLLMRWHIVMPLLTSIVGYFPGKRLGWLEDLPAGVAYEWSRRRSRLELSYPEYERDALLHRFASLQADILAIGVSDDEYGTPRAIQRGLEYYAGSNRTQLLLKPSDLGCQAIGHFSLFHSRHRDDFWSNTCHWLQTGANPWPQFEYDWRVVDPG